MTHEGIIIVGLLAMLVPLSSSDYDGLSFKLNRFDNDKFENPTAKKCGRKYKQFCTDTNSRCDGDCCRCTCDYQTSTFDSSEMKCQNNNEFRKGCSVKFDGKYAGNQIKTLDLAKLGDAKIYWREEVWTDVVKSFNIMNIAFYHGGSEWDPVSQDYHGQLFKVLISYTVEKKSNRRNVQRNDCFVFKSSGNITVTFPSPTTSTVSSSTTEESTAASTTQFSTSTTQSSTSTTPFSTSTTQSARSTTQSSTSTTPFSTSTTQSARSTTPSSASTTPSSTSATPSSSSTTGSVKPPVSTSEIPMTTKDSQKTRKPTEPAGKTAEPSKTGRTVAARNEDNDDEGGSNAVAISLAVVGCLLLLIGVILLVLWFRRRSGRASQEKRRGAVDAKESASNAVMMSQVESIYAEADNSANYSEKGKNNYVYDYAEGNVDGDYTSLDMSKVESKPTYQSLIDAQASLYEQIPADYDKNSSGVSGLNGGTAVTEPFYHVVDGQTQEPSEIYHVLEEPEVTGDCKPREVPGRTGPESPERVYSTLEENTSESCDRGVPEGTGDGKTREVPGRTGPESPERVYSTLEENTPESCDRGVPEGTGDDNPERLYSVLEDESAESDYLTILPETSDYEKSVNPPTSDA